MFRRAIGSDRVGAVRLVPLLCVSTWAAAAGSRGERGRRGLGFWWLSSGPHVLNAFTLGTEAGASTHLRLAPRLESSPTPCAREGARALSPGPWGLAVLNAVALGTCSNAVALGTSWSGVLQRGRAWHRPDHVGVWGPLSSLGPALLARCWVAGRGLPGMRLRAAAPTRGVEPHAV